MLQENQPSDPKRDRIEDSEPTGTIDTNQLSETECDRKTMLFWNGAGKPEGQYPVYREAVEQWNKPGAVDKDFDDCLKELRETQAKDERNWKTKTPKSWLWPWITALMIPVLAVSVVFVEIQANRMALQEQMKENREALQKTFDAQKELNRQQIIKDYVAQMTILIADKDLVTKYPKNEKGDYDPDGKKHPDAIAANLLTKTVLNLLYKRSIPENFKPSLERHKALEYLRNDLKLEETEYNDERGAILSFLSDSKLIQKENPVINLNNANFRGANLEKANLTHLDLQGINLSKANLIGAKLMQSDLSKATLISTRLHLASLLEVNLQGANLTKAYLDGATLFNANLEGAVVEKAYLYMPQGISQKTLKYLKKRGAIAP